MRVIGKALLRGILFVIQIPLTVVYFLFSFCGSLISVLGWLFGVMVFGTTIIFWIFGEFNAWYQIVAGIGIATAIVILPGWITDFVGEGIIFLKMALNEYVA